MSNDLTGTTVFEDVEPDPDAVLAAFGVTSPDDLVDGSDGAHDSVPDDHVDVDDATAAELFDDLKSFEGVFVGEPVTTVFNDNGTVDATAADLAALESTDEDAFVFGRTEPANGTGPADGASSSATGSLTVTASTADVDLVGPEPTSTRIATDRFGCVDR